MVVSGNPSPDRFSPAAERLLNILRPHTPFAEAIIRRQAERAGLSTATLSDAEAKRIAPMVSSAVAVFVDPDALAAIRKALQTV